MKPQKTLTDTMLYENNKLQNNLVRELPLDFGQCC